MKESYTIDTSAIMAYFLGEKGNEEISSILSRSQKGETIVYVSFMTYMEVLYRTWKLADEVTGRKAYMMLRNLPVKEIMQDEDLLLRAASIKATSFLSVADAWIAATAQKTGSTLIHKDPEMDNLRGIKTRKL
jgi:predicted nucleic acid-binding protein